MFSSEDQQKIYVISGPSGVGKDTLMEELIKRNSDLHIAITATTRPPRSLELQAVNHYFYDVDEFNKLINKNELLEWAEVYGNLYGLPKSEISNNINQGKKILVRVDVQGASRLKEIIPQAIYIFISPESEDDLRSRLNLRHEDSPVEIEARISRSRSELDEAGWFDFIIVNYSNQINDSVEELSRIIKLK